MRPNSFSIMSTHASRGWVTDPFTDPFAVAPSSSCSPTPSRFVMVIKWSLGLRPLGLRPWGLRPLGLRPLPIQCSSDPASIVQATIVTYLVSHPVPEVEPSNESQDAHNDNHRGT